MGTSKALVSGVIVIILIAVFAGFIGSGVVNKIFQTERTVNGTQLLIVEEQAREEQIRHEDLAREQQRIHEDAERSKQRLQILNDTQNIVMDHHQKLLDFMQRTNNTTEKLFNDIANNTDQNNLILKTLETVLAGIDNTTKQHQIVAKDHDKIQEEVYNVTDHIDSDLFKYGENSVTKLEEIKKAHDDMLNVLYNMTLSNKNNK